MVKIFDFIINNDEENVNIWIDSGFRAHLEYNRLDVGLNIYREGSRASRNFQTYV